MISSRLLVSVFATLFVAVPVAAEAAHVDMNDPRRAVGLEDDVRVDAQLIQDTVSSGSPVGITYQVQNLTRQSIAIADKVCAITYDVDSLTITVSIGSEVPSGGEMPHLTMIAPGDRKTFTAGGILHVATTTVRSPLAATPRFVEIHVNVLRDVAPFRSLIDEQSTQAAGAVAPILLSDQQFDKWLESNDTILLNAIPVRYNVAPKGNLGDASQRQSQFNTF
jgi:hypothetical protein